MRKLGYKDGKNIRIKYRSAGYVDKILKGARPTELPIQQPVLYRLVVNLKTARALGLKLPESILQRADELIQ